MTATLVFCVGRCRSSLFSDGLGQGAEQLLVKSIMDGFASIAFAASLGIGVMAAAIRWPSGPAHLLGFALGASCLLGRWTPSAPPVV